MVIDRSMAHPIHEASKSHPMGSFTGEEFFRKHRIAHRESFMLNREGMKIFTQSWQPAAREAPLRGVVGMVHGYACDSSWVFQLTAVAVAKLGFLVCALDLRGHGRSEGRRGHLPSVAPAVDDCAEYFESVRAKHPRLPAFLYGESFGGALAVLICLRQQQSRFWSGLILHSAMCGIAAKFKPPWPLETLLPLAAWAAPRWRVVLTKSLLEQSYKQGWVRELVRRNPRTERKCEYAPAATALEMIRVSEEVTRRSGELEVPLLVVHGAEDSVCDVESAMLVYSRARSKDKTLKIVAGMWHQLIGEEAETVEEGFGVIFAWLTERAEKASSSCSGHDAPVLD